MRKKNTNFRNLKQVKAWNAAHRSTMRASSIPAYVRLIIFKRTMEARDTPEGHLMTTILNSPRLRKEMLDILKTETPDILPGVTVRV